MYERSFQMQQEKYFINPLQPSIIAFHIEASYFNGIDISQMGENVY